MREKLSSRPSRRATIERAALFLLPIGIKARRRRQAANSGEKAVMIENLSHPAKQIEEELFYAALVS